MMESSGLFVRKTYCIHGLKSAWNTICSHRTETLPLHSFYYYKWLYYSFYANRFASRWRIVFYHLTDGINDSIVPLAVNKKKKLVKGLSCFGRLDYEDVISSTDDSSFISECLKRVFQRYRGYSLHLININESSVLYDVLKTKASFLENCVSIDIPSGLEEYITSLSKHQRQNIRTAYNKLSKEGFEVSLKHYDKGANIPYAIWRQCQYMYERRHDAQGGRFKIWLDRQKNPYTHILHSAKGWSIYVLFHNDVPISYMAGLLDEDQGCYYVPRLCIDEAYYKYSPGILLIVETIKQTAGHGLNQLDLMLGDEPYKTAMGGRIHKNYEVKCKVDDLLD